MITPAQCRGARGLLRLSQGDLAKAVKVHFNTLSQWEQGKLDLHQNHIAAIERALVERGLRIGENPPAIWIEPNREAK